MRAYEISWSGLSNGPGTRHCGPYQAKRHWHGSPPLLGAAKHDQWSVPGGSLTEADYRQAVEAGGFTGTTIVGTDLATLRFPANNLSADRGPMARPVP